MAEPKKYLWVCESDDGYFETSFEETPTAIRGTFSTQEEAYNDMRNAVLEKLKWNTNYTDFGDGVEFGSKEDTITYNVVFNPTSIVHTSYSGTYTYKVVERLPMPTIPKQNDEKIGYSYNPIKQCTHFFKTLNNGVKVYFAHLYDNGYLDLVDRNSFNNPSVLKCVCEMGQSKGIYDFPKSVLI